MVRLKGVAVCFFTSLLCSPLIHNLLGHPLMSQKLPMMCLQYSLFATSVLMFVAMLEPSSDFWNFEKRGSFLYFLFCLLTCVSVVQITLNVNRFNLIGKPKKAKYFEGDEQYLGTPFGMSSEAFQSIFTYVVSMLAVLQMDNETSPRNLALYWCGATITNIIVTGIALLSGPLAAKIQFSSWMHVFYFVMALFVSHNFVLVNKRRYPVCEYYTRRSVLFDILVAILLGFCMIYNAMRLLCAFNATQKFIKDYTAKFEPCIVEPTKFPFAWILFAGVYGIPCCLQGIYDLNNVGCQRNLEMAFMHAGSMLQGTFVYVSFSWYTKANKFQIPDKSYPIVAILNLLVVCAAHMLAIRCFVARSMNDKEAKTNESSQNRGKQSQNTPQCMDDLVASTNKDGKKVCKRRVIPQCEGTGTDDSRYWKETESGSEEEGDEIEEDWSQCEDDDEEENL